MHKVLLIGLGYHARRIHVPILKEMSSTAQLVVVVDVEQERELITKYVGDHDLSPELYFLSNEQKKDGKVWRKILDEIVKRHDRKLLETTRRFYPAVDVIDTSAMDADDTIEAGWRILQSKFLKGAA